jgi:ribosome-associated protein
MIRITDRIALAETELDYRFVRASGPGGQNVNKVASAVELRFDITNSPSLSEAVKQRLLKLAGRRVDSTGVLQIDARRHRTQEMNRRDALERLTTLVREAAKPPVPRVATRPSKSARRERTDNKTKRGALKQSRRRPDHE